MNEDVTEVKVFALSRQAIIDWLKTQPRERVLGGSGTYACQCPVALYLKEAAGYRSANVPGRLHARVRTPANIELFLDLPEDVGNLVETFDSMPGLEHTVGEFLREFGEA